MLLNHGAKLELGEVRVVEADVVGLALHFLEVGDAVQKRARHVADVDVIALEMPLKNQHRAVVDGAIDKIIHEQIHPHARRAAEHRGEAEADAVFARQHGFLGLDFGDAVARNRAQRRVFGAEFPLFADAVAAVGDGHDDPLLFAGEAANHFDRFLICGLGGDGIGVAKRHADERGERDDQIRLGDERLDDGFLAAIAADDLEFLELAAVEQAVLVEIKIVEHGDFMPLGKQCWRENRAEITGAAGDEDFHSDLFIADREFEVCESEKSGRRTEEFQRPWPKSSRKAV